MRVILLVCVCVFVAYAGDYVLATNDGGVLIVRANSELIEKFDSYCKQQWQFKCPNRKLISVVETKEGEVVFVNVGDSHNYFLNKLSKIGEQVWTWPVPKGIYASGIGETEEGDYIVVGATDGGYLRCLKINGNAQILWDRTYDEKENEIIASCSDRDKLNTNGDIVKELANGSIALMVALDLSFAKVIKIANDGKLLWHSDYIGECPVGHTYMALDEGLNGGAIIVCRVISSINCHIMWLSKFSADGTVLYNKKQVLQNRNEHLFSVQLSNTEAIRAIFYENTRIEKRENTDLLDIIRFTRVTEVRDEILPGKMLGILSTNCDPNNLEVKEVFCADFCPKAATFVGNKGICILGTRNKEGDVCIKKIDY